MGGSRGAIRCREKVPGRRYVTTRLLAWHLPARRATRRKPKSSPFGDHRGGSVARSGTVSRNRCRLAVTAAHIDQAEAPTFRADRDGAAELGRELQV